MDSKLVRAANQGYSLPKLSNYQRQAFIWEAKYTLSNFKIFSKVAQLQILVIHFFYRSHDYPGRKKTDVLKLPSA